MNPLFRPTPVSRKKRKRDRNRAVAIRLAGRPKPTLRDRAVRALSAPGPFEHGSDRCTNERPA